MEHNIVLVGAGPRGTYCLRRLVIHFQRHPPVQQVNIYMIEKSGKFGGGSAHSTTLPSYLLLNTIGSQITAFGDDDAEARSAEERKTLWGYLTNKGIQIEKNGYPSRAQHGRYLADMFQWSVSKLPPNVKVHCIHSEVLDIVPGKGHRFDVVTSDAEPISADEVLLITGHAVGKIKQGSSAAQWLDFAQEQQKKGKEISYTHFVYPLPEKVEHIQPAQTLYIQGLGLTAIDVVKAVTLGRGGRFENGKYIPTGKEPHVILGSRLGLPPSARSVNQRETQYQGKRLTLDNVLKIRQQHEKIDFIKDVFPLVLEEMEYVYYSTMLGAPFGEQLLSLKSPQDRKELIEKQVPPENRFNWSKLENPLWDIEKQSQPNQPLFDSPDSFNRFVMGFMEDDIQEADKGNLTSPLKTAVDSVLRDLRDTLRTIVDHGGLTVESHRFLVKQFGRTNNRIAVGPPVSAMKDLLVLIKEGIVSFSGPSPSVNMDADEGVFILESEKVANSRQSVHHIVNGRIHGVEIREDSSALYQQLFAKDWIRNFVNKDDSGTFELGGLDVTDDFQLITTSGDVLQNICGIGIPLEGKLWFNAADARPDVNSNAIKQLDRWIEAMAIRLDKPGRS